MARTEINSEFLTRPVTRRVFLRAVVGASFALIASEHTAQAQEPAVPSEQKDPQIDYQAILEGAGIGLVVGAGVGVAKAAISNSLEDSEDIPLAIGGALVGGFLGGYLSALRSQT